MLQSRRILVLSGGGGVKSLKSSELVLSYKEQALPVWMLNGVFVCLQKFNNSGDMGRSIDQERWALIVC